MVDDLLGWAALGSVRVEALAQPQRGSARVRVNAVVDASRAVAGTEAQAQSPAVANHGRRPLGPVGHGSATTIFP